MSQTQRIAIFGVTGFVGKELPALLAGHGFVITGVSRSGTGDIPGVDRWRKPDGIDLSGYHAVINLAGEPIARRWTADAKRRFHESRVDFTRRIVGHIGSLPEEDRPQRLINASAVGYYGDRGDERLTEDAAPGDGYLADLCRAWENAADDVESHGVRCTRLRIGIVLGRDEGAYAKLRRLFRTGLGGKLGSGRQWMPWIHIDDLRAAIVHAVLSPTLQGAVNGTAPEPETNAAFTRKLAASLHRPAFLPAPAFGLKLMLGEFGGALLAGQRAVPAALEADGFAFRHRTLDSALTDLAE